MNIDDAATIILMELMRLHYRAAVEGNETRRVRLFNLIEEFEWAFPDAKTAAPAPKDASK